MINLPIFLWVLNVCAGTCVEQNMAIVDTTITENKIRFKKVHGEEIGGAVLGLGKHGKFDAEWVTCPTIVWDGNQYKMWYSSFYDSKMGVGGIGLASSNDGINWQRQNNGEPVIRISAGNGFDGGQVMGPEVLKSDRGYSMWYTGMAKVWHQSGHGFYQIGLATSRNGISWKRANASQPVVKTGKAKSFDHVQAATPSIIKENTGYKMWYAAWSPDPDKKHRICMAHSSDGIKWIKENGGMPISGLMPEFAYAPAVVRSGNSYVLFYMATGSKGLFAATSQDGIHWTMLNKSNPVLLPGTGEDFDNLYVGHPFALIRDGKIMLWYTGYKSVKSGMELSIGLAVQDL
jgi:predicted GH43/DUF377 family glycosyl hydrolase